MPYSGNPADSPRDEVYFMLGGKIAEDYLSDEEIDYLIVKHESRGSLTFTAAAACDSICSRLASEIDLTSDNQSLALGQLFERFKALGDLLRDQAGDENVGAAEFYADGVSKYPPTFGMRMWDNPEAGLQEYGWIGDARMEHWEHMGVDIPRRG